MTEQQFYPSDSPSCELESVHQTELSELRAQSSRLGHLLEVMPAGVILVDGDGIVQQANKVATDLLKEPLQGERWRQVIERAFRPQDDDGHEVSLVDGRKVKLSISPLNNEPGLLIVLTDLTETRLLQQRVSHMQKLSSLGRMVASLAHQIRTPLSAAMLYAANLQNPTLKPGSQEQFADKLMSRLKDLEQQVNDMLLFAKSGGDQVATELSLQSLMLEVEAGAEAMLAARNGAMTVTLPEPDILVVGNKTALASALQNLIHNSLQACGNEAQLQLLARRDASDPESVVISVTDNGPGFKAEQAKQAFEPFFTTKTQGTGLGLAVVKAVAQSHQGWVNACNHEGGGACVSLHLPIQRELASPGVASAQ